MWTRQLFSRASQALAGRGPIAPAFRNVNVTRVPQLTRSYVAVKGWKGTPTSFSQSSILSLCTPFFQKTLPSPYLRCTSRTFSSQSVTRAISAREEMGQLKEESRQAMLILTSQLSREYSEIARDINFIKAGCFGKSDRTPIHLLKGMFQLISVVHPKWRDVKATDRRIKKLLHDHAAADSWDLERKQSHLINPQTGCVSNRDLAQPEKLYRDIHSAWWLEKIDKSVVCLQQKAYQRFKQLPTSHPVRELALKTLVDDSGMKWDEESAAKLWMLLQNQYSTK